MNPSFLMIYQVSQKKCSFRGGLPFSKGTFFLGHPVWQLLKILYLHLRVVVCYFDDLVHKIMNKPEIIYPNPFLIYFKSHCNKLTETSYHRILPLCWGLETVFQFTDFISLKEYFLKISECKFYIHVCQVILYLECKR